MGVDIGAVIGVGMIWGIGVLRRSVGSEIESGLILPKESV